MRQRDWAGMLFELLIVALGVLLGIEASNWNAGRERSARQKEMLGQLASELDDTVAEADQRVAFSRQGIADMTVVKIAVDSGQLDPNTAKRFPEGICRAGGAWKPAWRLGTVDQLISSGELDLIPDPKLRSGLIAYRDTVSVIRDDIGMLGSDITSRLPALDPYVEYGLPPGLLAARSEADIVALPLGQCETDLAALHADPVARNAIKHIVSAEGYILGNQLAVREEAVRLRNMLKNER